MSPSLWVTFCRTVPPSEAADWFLQLLVELMHLQETNGWRDCACLDQPKLSCRLFFSFCRLCLCFLCLPVRIVTRVPGDWRGRDSLADAEHCLFADLWQSCDLGGCCTQTNNQRKTKTHTRTNKNVKQTVCQTVLFLLFSISDLWPPGRRQPPHYRLHWMQSPCNFLSDPVGLEPVSVCSYTYKYCHPSICWLELWLSDSLNWQSVYSDVSCHVTFYAPASCQVCGSDQGGIPRDWLVVFGPDDSRSRVSVHLYLELHLVVEKSRHICLAWGPQVDVTSVCREEAWERQETSAQIDFINFKLDHDHANVLSEIHTIHCV